MIVAVVVEVAWLLTLSETGQLQRTFFAGLVDQSCFNVGFHLGVLLACFLECLGTLEIKLKR